jgi:hypothetical protein
MREILAPMSLQCVSIKEMNAHWQLASLRINATK